MTTPKADAVRTRFAPSPTGVLHLGSVRTALFSWLYARHCAGQFVLRIEDTDRARSTQENVDAILDGMQWLGLDYDEGPFFQTRRMDRYAEVIDEWLRDDKAYYCYCSRERLDALREKQLSSGERVRYDGRCRELADPPETASRVVRFRNPAAGQVVVNDIVRGRVTFENEQLDDLIIARSDGSPTYNFVVVVDDFDMGITHVVRGDDHLNNTPRQVNMIAALGAEPPAYGHLPMILGADGSKLSKRHGAVDIREYRSAGYLPAAMLNYLARLGWSHGDQEIFSIDQMIELFDVKDVNQSASTFNPQKLLWLNQQHIIAAPAPTLGAALAPFLVAEGVNVSDGPPLEAVVEAFRQRSETLADMAKSATYCFRDELDLDPDAAKRHLRPVAQAPLEATRDALANLEAWDVDGIEAALRAVADRLELSLGKIGQPLRVAVTGTSVSPPIDVTLQLAGRDRTLARIDAALAYIADRKAAAGQ